MGTSVRVLENPEVKLQAMPPCICSIAIKVFTAQS
jgi:hypothetical protein